MSTEKNENVKPQYEYPDPSKWSNSSLISALAVICTVLIHGIPLVICSIPFLIHSPIWVKVIQVLISPVEYSFLLGVVGGLLSLPTHRGIVRGVFPRKTSHPVYALRKIYGTCWTSVYYFKPAYSIILSIPFFKRVVFRLFGYKGSMNFTLYPDTWIRDLPLLVIEDGVYIANRSTVGTNICLRDGNILVNGLTLKKDAILGHLSILAMGCTVGERTEIGLDIAIGLNTKIGSDCTIGTTSVISHKCRIGNNVDIGVCSFIGTGSVIADGITLPSNTLLPDSTQILTQSDVDKYVRKVE
jgi:carbonic anhydrase/acetyltransferase-like protein (isoleucine patch superfamily)